MEEVLSMMRWMRISSLEQFTPIGLIATGILIGAGSPVIKKGLRGLAVLTTKGILNVTDNLKETGEQLTDNWRQLVTEARDQREICKLNLKEQLHIAGVTAVKGGLNVADELQGIVNQAKGTINMYVEEARRELEKSVNQTTYAQTASEENEPVCHCSNSDQDNHESKANYDLSDDDHEYDNAKNYKN